MAETIGRVECIQVGDDFGFVGIREDVSNTFEAFIIWFAPELPTAFTRLLHNMWLSMLREAFTSGDLVRIVHGANNAFIRNLEIRK
jgi:hypothetical protein